MKDTDAQATRRANLADCKVVGDYVAFDEVSTEGADRYSRAEEEEFLKFDVPRSPVFRQDVQIQLNGERLKVWRRVE